MALLYGSLGRVTAGGAGVRQHRCTQAVLLTGQVRAVPICSEIMRAFDGTCQAAQLGVRPALGTSHNLRNGAPESASLPPVTTLCACSTGVCAAIAEAPRHAAPAAHASADVGLKDAPLRSLYPDELPPPAPVLGTLSLRAEANAVVLSCLCSIPAFRVDHRESSSGVLPAGVLSTSSDPDVLKHDLNRAPYCHVEAIQCWGFCKVTLCRACMLAWKGPLPTALPLVSGCKAALKG